MEKFIILYSPSRNFDDLTKYKKYAQKNNYIPLLCYDINELCVLLSRTSNLVYNKNEFNFDMIKGLIPHELKLNMVEIGELGKENFAFGNFDESIVDKFVDDRQIFTTSIAGIIVHRLLKIMLINNISKIFNDYVYFYLNSLGMDHFTLNRVFREYFKQPNYCEFKNITTCINKLYEKIKENDLLAS